MALERFIPKSPDPFIRNSQDFEVAKFGHLNTIIEYINSYVVTDSLQLAGSGPITSTARYITDSLGNASAISISTTRVGIGTTTPSAELHIDGHNGFGYSLRISTNKVGGVAYAGLISDYVTGVEQYQYGGPGWGWPNWTTTRAGGTAAAPTAVPSNYGLNEYSFWGHDGTGGGQAYSMMTRTSETWTTTAHGIYTTFNTVATGSTALVERMRFTGSGNITFNNASDTAKVAIKGTGSTSATTSFLVQNNSGTEVLKVTDNRVVTMYGLGINAASIEGRVLFNLSNDCIISTPTSFQVKSGVTDQVGLYLNGNNGNVGIGTNAPVNIFQVKTTQSNANGSIIFANNTVATILAATDTGSALTQLQFRASSYNFTDASGMRIASTGYATTPSAMLQVVGSGSTSATTSLLVQNSSGTNLLKISDNGFISLVAQNGAGFDIDAPLGNFTTTGGNEMNINGITATNIKVNNGIVARFISGNMLLGTTSNVSSSKLTIESTTQGFLPPRMTTAQRTAISSPAAGLVVFDTTLQNLCYYRDGVWVQATFTAA